MAEWAAYFGVCLSLGVAVASIAVWNEIPAPVAWASLFWSAFALSGAAVLLGARSWHARKHPA
jgi:hypothetical protein